MVHLGAERLAQIEMRRVHVATPVADHGFVDARLRFADGDTLVVHLDLLARLEIVVDDHLAARADQGAPDLQGRKPVHVDVGNRCRFEKEREIGDRRGPPLDVFHARRRHGGRLEGKNVVENGEVVHGQIPDDVYIRLDEAQVDPNRVEVVEVSELSRVDHRLDLSDCSAVHERVVHVQDEPGTLRRGYEFSSLLGGLRQRLLEEDVLASSESLAREIEVGRYRSHDRNCIDFGVGEECLVIRCGGHSGVPRTHELQPLLVEVAHGHEFGPRRFRKIAGEIRPPVAVSDESCPDHVRSPPPKSTNHRSSSPSRANSFPICSRRSQERNAELSSGK